MDFEETFSFIEERLGGTAWKYWGYGSDQGFELGREAGNPAPVSAIVSNAGACNGRDLPSGLQRILRPRNEKSTRTRAGRLGRTHAALVMETGDLIKARVAITVVVCAACEPTWGTVVRLMIHKSDR